MRHERMTRSPTLGFMKANAAITNPATFCSPNTYALENRSFLEQTQQSTKSQADAMLTKLHFV